jgi:multisubunit Na+/H+ antiporter MnhC subunit
MDNISILIYLSSALLFLIGLYGIICKEHMLKIIIGVKIMGYGICLFFIFLAFRHGGSPPIVPEGGEVRQYVDPLPQALIPAIMVIGLAATALMLATAVRLYEKYGTFDVSKIKRLRG